MFGVFLSAFKDAPANTPEDVALQYTRALYEGDIDKMAGLVLGIDSTKPEDIAAFKRDLSAAMPEFLAALPAIAEQTKQLGGLKTVRPDPEKKTIMHDENNATVFVEATFAGNESLEEVHVADGVKVSGGSSGSSETTLKGGVNLTKENGKWRVKLY